MTTTTPDPRHPIIELEHRALERWSQGDPDGYMEISAPDIVYFDPFRERRVDGRPALARIYDDLRGKVSVARFEITNPLVQTVDRAAVLTYNLVCHMPHGPVRWNCTEVYRCDADERWWIIQSHWSYTWPPPQSPGPVSG